MPREHGDPGAGGEPRTLDFELLFRSAPTACLVLAPDLTVVAASDAYLNATATRREEIVGRPVFDVYPEDAGLRASLGRVLIEKRSDAMAIRKYEVHGPGSEANASGERYFSPVNVPVIGADGQIAYVIHRMEDASDRVRLQRQEAEARELALREARNGQLLDTAPDAIVVVRDDGRIELVNRQAEQMFGYARSELVGQPLTTLVPERFRHIHGQHEAGFFANPAARPMGARMELFGRRKDGADLPIEVSLSPLRTERGATVSAAIRDIRARKRLEATAKLAADRLTSAVESIQDAFALFDDKDQLVLCNSVYRRMVGEGIEGPVVGKSYEEVLQAFARDLAFPDELSRERFREERLARRKEPTSSFDVRTRDGRSLRVIDRRTAEGGLVKTIWDLTDDERRAEELREARAAAEAGSAAKSDFLSSMSHELRTPLNAILGFAQLLQRDRREPLPERHKERVNQIVKGGEHLLHLIDDILDLSRIEAGGVSISTEPVDVIEVLDEVQRALEPLAARQGLHIELDASSLEGVPTIAADRTRFAQILMNFGSNAIKYNRPGGKVTFLTSAPGPDRIRVTVRDTGMGIPAEKQTKLFQPFQRAGQETGPIEGTGIGLVISKRLATLMDGDVGFRSVSGEGSEFWVDMPMHAAGTRSSQPPAVRDRGALFGGERSRTVLYVEDNPANVTFMRDLMDTFENVDLLTAPTAEIGIDLARQRSPEAVIMDINLPGMSGLDALRQLRASAETMSIPVIALTAAASERDRQRGMQAGFYRYLTKPVKVDELLTALEELLASN